MDIPSFEVVKDGARKTVRINKGGCPANAIGIGFRQLPNRFKEYFVTCNRREPTECHLVIRSRVAPVDGQPLPRGASLRCRGDCDPQWTCLETNAVYPIPNQHRSIQYCSCQHTGRLKQKAEFPHLEPIEMGVVEARNSNEGKISING